MSIFRKKRSAEQLPGSGALPRHVAIIMDGNGRWAKKRRLPRSAGHAAGSETFRRIATYCKDLGLEYLTVYAFSTENWKRPESEVETIMGLLEKYLDEAIDSMERDGIRLRVFGDIQRLSPTLRERIRKTDSITEQIKGFQVNVCINYGGRADILRAVKKLAEEAKDGVLDPEDISEEHIAERLYSAGIPDPDLIIRPSGEYRLSNFQLWQCAYSELYFTDILWPDFDEAELDRALAVYQKRSRRYGGV